MPTGLRLGAVAGVPIFMDWSIAILAAFYVLPPIFNYGLAAAPLAIAALGALIVAVLIHEGGHALAASVSQVKSRRIVLTGFGGYVELAGAPPTRWHDIAISAAGPIANLATAAAVDPLGALLPLGPAQVFLDQLASVSLALGAFNLLPAFPLDGGAIARKVMTIWLWERTATQIVVWIGIVLGLYLAAAGFAAGGWATVIGIYILTAALAERQRLRGR